jgi:hypothetical protein
MARRKRELTGTSLDNQAGGSDIIGATAFDAGVELYQQQLLDLGYSLGKFGADGKLGADTAKAIKAFQAKEGLPQTGVMDPMTLQRLAQRIAEKKSGGASSDADTKLLEDMMKSTDLMDYVKKAQGEVATSSDAGTTSPGAGTTMVSSTTNKPAPSDKILGLPKNVAIGGGIALGVLAILGLYMLMKKGDSGSQSEQGFTDEEGRRWGVDDHGEPFLSDSLAERMERHRRMPSPYRRPSYPQPRRLKA